MLTKLTVDFEITEEMNASVRWGSLFHGIMMKELPAAIASRLHDQSQDQSTRPYSHYVEPVDSRTLRWHIGIWDKNITPVITQTVMGLSSVELTGRNIVLQVHNATRESISKEEYIGNFYSAARAERCFDLIYKSPSTHKRAGSYVAFPDINLIYDNLSSRFLAFTQTPGMDNKDAIAQLSEHTRIVRHAIRSAPYGVEGITILGYMGFLRVMLFGPDAIIRLGGLLLSLAEYMGVGIKTAMGMGGCQVIAVQPKNNLEME